MSILWHSMSVSCLVIAIIVAFVVVIHLQCLVSVYLSLVKIKYSVWGWKTNKQKKARASTESVLAGGCVRVLQEGKEWSSHSVDEESEWTRVPVSLVTDWKWERERRPVPAARGWDGCLINKCTPHRQSNLPCDGHSSCNGRSDHMVLLVLLLLGFWDSRAKQPDALDFTMQNYSSAPSLTRA